VTSLKEHKYLILLIVLVGALIVQSLHPALLRCHAADRLGSASNLAVETCG
jgi:hypothetical protein